MKWDIIDTPVGLSLALLASVEAPSHRLLLWLLLVPSTSCVLRSMLRNVLWLSAPVSSRGQSHKSYKTNF